MEHKSGFLALVEMAKKQVAEISALELADELQRNKSVILIDVREDKEWEEGRVPNAVHIGKGVLEARIESVIEDKNTELVLYCRGGFRSILAAFALQQMGYLHVKSLTGGCKAWANAGLPFDGEVKLP